MPALGTDQQTASIGHNVSLAALDLLGRIVTTRPTALGRLDRLTVDDPGRSSQIICCSTIEVAPCGGPIACRPLSPIPQVVFLLYQKGRDFRIFQAPATADRLRHRRRLSARANGSAHVGVVPLQPFAKAEPPACSDLEVDPVRPQRRGYRGNLGI